MMMSPNFRDIAFKSRVIRLGGHPTGQASGHGSSTVEEESEPRNKGGASLGEIPGPTNQFA
jgi:hypothetical protein